MDKYLQKNRQITKSSLSPQISPLSEDNSPEEIEYLNSLTPKELKAYHIAKTHLKTSFTLTKAQGYKKYHSNKSA